jgi:hypothetical protein
MASEPKLVLSPREWAPVMEAYERMPSARRAN